LNYGFKNIANSTTKKNKKTVTLNYTETPAITQGLASDNAVSVQPFLFGSFNGTLELFPETDYWINESLKPEIISVPERIIEHHHVIREIVKEPAPPITIVNKYYTTNVVNQIIVAPGDDPVDPPPDDVPPVDPPADPPVVIPPEPVLPDPTPPPAPPTPPVEDPPFFPIITPAIDLEFDPCFINVGMNFTFGTTGVVVAPGCQHGGMWGKGGITDLWFPPTDIPQVDPLPPVLEPQNPTKTTPINLVGKTGGGGSGATGGGGNGRAALEFDFSDTKFK
jgi:hypothetical protein